MARTLAGIKLPSVSGEVRDRMCGSSRRASHQLVTFTDVHCFASCATKGLGNLHVQRQLHAAWLWVSGFVCLSTLPPHFNERDLCLADAWCAANLGNLRQRHPTAAEHIVHGLTQRWHRPAPGFCLKELQCVADHHRLGERGREVKQNKSELVHARMTRHQPCWPACRRCRCRCL